VYYVQICCGGFWRQHSVWGVASECCAWKSVATWRHSGEACWATDVPYVCRSKVRQDFPHDLSNLLSSRRAPVSAHRKISFLCVKYRSILSASMRLLYAVFLSLFYLLCTVLSAYFLTLEYIWNPGAWCDVSGHFVWYQWQWMPVFERWSQTISQRIQQACTV